MPASPAPRGAAGQHAAAPAPPPPRRRPPRITATHSVPPQSARFPALSVPSTIVRRKMRGKLARNRGARGRAPSASELSMSPATAAPDLRPPTKGPMRVMRNGRGRRGARHRRLHVGPPVPLRRPPRRVGAAACLSSCCIAYSRGPLQSVKESVSGSGGQVPQRTIAGRRVRRVADRRLFDAPGPPEGKHIWTIRTRTPAEPGHAQSGAQTAERRAGAQPQSRATSSIPRVGEVVPMCSARFRKGAS